MGHARNCLSKDVELGLTINQATKCGSHVLSCSENGGHSLPWPMSSRLSLNDLLRGWGSSSVGKAWEKYVVRMMARNACLLGGLNIGLGRAKQALSP